MKFNAEDLRLIIDGDHDEDKFEVIEEGEWLVDCKYQHQEIIFKYQGKHYLLEHSRSGSPFTDYYYCSDDWRGEMEVPECIQVTRSIKEWQVKK